MDTMQSCAEGKEKSFHKHQTRQPEVIIFGSQYYYFSGQPATRHFMSIWKKK
jgi:hypothetical protein